MWEFSASSVELIQWFVWPGSELCNHVVKTSTGGGNPSNLLPQDIVGQLMNIWHSMEVKETGSETEQSMT